MTETTFRTLPEVSEPTPKAILPDPIPNNVGGEPTTNLVSPEEVDTTLRDVLGIENRIDELPSDAQSNVNEIKEYLKSSADAKGIPPSKEAFAKILGVLKEDMGLDPLSSPEMVIDRIGGVIKAWKELAFVKDPKEKRSLFMRIARMPSAKAMNEFVFREMEHRRVWQ